jgi:hypothetical protein
MSVFNPGTTAFVKTTNEEVFVLGVSGNLSPFQGPENVMNEIGPFSGTTVIVRRPKLGQEGIIHTVDFFLVEELETLEDRVRREKDCQDRVRATLNSLDKTNEPATVKEMMN